MVYEPEVRREVEVYSRYSASVHVSISDTGTGARYDLSFFSQMKRDLMSVLRMTLPIRSLLVVTVVLWMVPVTGFA